MPAVRRKSFPFSCDLSTGRTHHSVTSRRFPKMLCPSHAGQTATRRSLILPEGLIWFFKNCFPGPKLQRLPPSPLLKKTTPPLCLNYLLQSNLISPDVPLWHVSQG